MQIELDFYLKEVEFRAKIVELQAVGFAVAAVEPLVELAAEFAAVLDVELAVELVEPAEPAVPAVDEKQRNQFSIFIETLHFYFSIYGKNFNNSVKCPQEMYTIIHLFKRSQSG